MVKVDNSYKTLMDLNIKIAQIIDETIKDYSGKKLTFFKNKYADPISPDNWIFSDKKQKYMIFNGELRSTDYADKVARFKVMDKKYFDWVMSVSEKVEKKLGLEVLLEELY